MGRSVIKYNKPETIKVPFHMLSVSECFIDDKGAYVKIPDLTVNGDLICNAMFILRTDNNPLVRKFGDLVLFRDNYSVEREYMSIIVGKE